jgi:hypothetical protein
MATKFEIPNEIYSSLLVSFRPSTIRTNTYNLKRVLLEVFGVEEYTIEPLMRFKRVRKYLRTLKNIDMRKSLIGSVISFLKVEKNVPTAILERYQKYFKKLADKSNNDRLYRKPKKEELEHWMPWKEIVKRRNQFKLQAECIDEFAEITFEDTMTYLRYILLCLYTYIPPLRGEEYLNAIVVSVSNPRLYKTIRDMTGRNLFDTNHRKFIVYGYKTSGKYGVRVIDIPEVLVDIVVRWTKLMETQLLLPVLSKLPKEEPMTHEALNYVFKTIFEPKKISTSMLRKIYISSRLKKLKDPEKRKELALIMGHSLQTQEFIYSRFIRR